MQRWGEDKPENLGDLQENPIPVTTQRMERIVDSIFERGYENRSSTVDDYSILLQRREFRELVIVEIYESYFPPSRHEFDYLLIREVVEAVVKSPLTMFLAGAVASEIIGGTAYDLTKHLARVISERFRGRDRERASTWQAISEDIKRIEDFYLARERATTSEVENSTGIERERLLPLLKLLGFSYEREKGKSGWVKKSSSTAQS